MRTASRRPMTLCGLWRIGSLSLTIRREPKASHSLWIATRSPSEKAAIMSTLRYPPIVVKHQIKLRIYALKKECASIASTQAA
jgi:hypothetical protein